MHRRFIHRAYDCPHWLERFAGLSGHAARHGRAVRASCAFTIFATGRSANRECHDFFSHRRSLVGGRLVAADQSLRIRAATAIHDRARIRAGRLLSMAGAHLDAAAGAAREFCCTSVVAGAGWSGACRCASRVSVIGHWVVTYLTHNPCAGTLACSRRRSAGDQSAGVRIRSRWASAGTLLTTMRSRSRRASVLSAGPEVDPAIGKSFAACRTFGLCIARRLPR